MSDPDKHCGTCHYFSFAPNTWPPEKWCRHPDHCTPLKKWGGKCWDWISFDFKGLIEKVKVKF